MKHRKVKAKKPTISINRKSYEKILALKEQMEKEGVSTTISNIASQLIVNGVV